MEKRLINSIVKGAIDSARRVISGIVGSTGVVDRQGESINPAGWILDNFLKNPVILFAHDYSSLPVGKATRVYIENGALIFDIEFAETEMAKDVFKLFEGGFLNAVSVGLIPKKWGVAGVDQYDIMEQELLELSVVPVPANPEALANVKAIEEFSVKYADELKKKEDEPAVVPVTDPPAAEEKSGRTLSAANEEKLRNALTSITEVLASLDGKAEEAPSLKELIREVIREEIEAKTITHEKVIEIVKDQKPTEEKISEEAHAVIKSLREGLRTADVGVGNLLRSMNEIMRQQREGGEK